MAGGLDNLSAEGLSKLSKTINEAKELLKQQEALLQQTLSMEQRIIDRRVAGLKEYEDAYSKLLNRISAEQASLSAELAKIVELGKEAASNTDRAAGNAERATKSSNASSDGSGTNQNADSRSSTGLGTQEIADIVKAVLAASRQETEKTGASTQAGSAAGGDGQQTAQSTDSVQGGGGNNRSTRNIVEPENLAGTLTESFSAEDALHDYRMALDEERREADFSARRANEEAMFSTSGQEQPQVSANTNSESGMQDLIDNALNSKAEADQEYAEKLSELFEDAAEAFEERFGEKSKSSNNKHKALDEKYSQATSFKLSRDDSLSDHFKDLKALFKITLAANGGNAVVAGLSVATKVLSSLAQHLEKNIDEIALYKGKIDTRMHGSKMETKSVLGNSYWDQLVHDMTRVGAINPYFKQADWSKKIEELVDKGIAHNIAQRSFLATISNKIATTFDVTDATLLRLVRIQQQDSTAGRLGMEAALNAFLNEMYENTEYLKNVAGSVRTSLAEMEALMERSAATEVEFQVQKWMGSLFSVGMSQEAVNAISKAFGEIAAGQIEGLTGEGAGNLLIMAANDAGLSIAEILTEGLDADETNALLQATVNYLAEIAAASQDNQVVQQQLAKVFGVKASDLKAATNLASEDSVATIFDENMSYDNMLKYLNDMAGSMVARTSFGEMMTNVWDNLQYSLAGSIASNPISYGIYKAATLLDNIAGGIDFGLPLVMGSGTAQTFNIADIMRAGALSTGILGSIGALAKGMINSFSGSLMLKQLGIEAGAGLDVVQRGDGLGLAPPDGDKKTTSDSGYVGNNSASDIKSTTMQETEDSQKQQMIEALENAEETQIDTINATVLKIYELLDEVASGKSSFSVKVEGYGLTRTGTGSGAIGGVNALDSLGGGNSTGSSTGVSGGGVNAGSFSGSISFGGWTTSI